MNSPGQQARGTAIVSLPMQRLCLGFFASVSGERADPAPACGKGEVGISGPLSFGPSARHHSHIAVREKD